VTNQTLRLDDDELRLVFELINPVEIVETQLIERAADRGGHAARQTGRLVPGTVPGSEILVEDPSSGIRCLLPGSSLAALRMAALAALVTNELLAAGVVTAAVLGSTPAVQLYLAVAARHVSSLSFLAACPEDQTVDPRALGMLAGAGVSVSVVADVDEAVFGANLLVVADPYHRLLPTNGLALGSLLVNMSGQDMPDRLVNAVDGIYVDDAGLIEENRHRRFVRRHLDASTSEAKPLRRPEGWYRPLGWRDERRIDADLGQVLCGAHPGRTHVDDVLLVELLGSLWLDIPLAGQLQRAALEHGIGTWLLDAEPDTRK
jgi:ornithine cyclodeaminase/alanine dehydrogenase-like protein (mu-crystallin family)